MANFQLFVSVKGTGSSPTGPDPENRVGDQDSGSRPVSSGLQVPGEPGHCRQEEDDPLDDLPTAGVFPSKRSSIAPAEMSNTAR